MEKEKRNRGYWKNRALQIEARQGEKADKYQKQIEEQYIRALSSIQKTIESFYMRYAEAEEVDYATAKRNLSNAEKEMWEVDLAEYRKMALDEEFNSQIESMYSKSRVSRLQALQSQIRAQIEVLNKNGVEATKELLEDTFTDTYYRTVYEIQKGIGIGTNFAIYNQDAVDVIIRKPWKGNNFSNRWGVDKSKLLDELETALVQAFIRGDSVDKTIDVVAKKMKRSKDWAANIVQTESAFIAGEATAIGYRETGVHKYEFLATLDLITSDLCRSLDGELFDLKEKKVGVNYPPMHCFCRSTTVPYFEDEEGYSKRIARQADGGSYYVPKDMKYKEWYKQYVEDGNQ